MFTPLNCQDADPCTIDDCVDGICTHTGTFQVLSFTLVNALTDLDIRQLNENDTVNLNCEPSFSIRANVCGPLESVRFRVNANPNYKTENVEPYAIAGDAPAGNYYKWVVVPGFYAITATPYTANNASGAPGTPKTINLLVINNAPCAPPCATAADCNDNNSCTNDMCTFGVCTNPPFCNDDNLCTLNKCTGGVCSYPPKCSDGDPCTNDICNPVTSACSFPPKCNDSNACTNDFCNPGDGACTHVPILCIDFNPCTDDACNPVTGCVFTPNGLCCVTNSDCNDGNPCTVDVCSSGTCSNTFPAPRVVESFTLVNSTSNLDIGPLNNGDIIFLGLTPDINVRANLCTNTGTGSVRFRLNANPNFRTENVSPFALAGDAPPGDYYKWNVTPGIYTIEATPWSGTGATGTMGISKAITVSIMSGTPKLSVEDKAASASKENELMLTAYPNPFTNKVTISFSVQAAERVRIDILGIDGRLLAALFDGTASEKQIHNVEFYSGNLAGSMYFYRMLTESGKVENRKLLLVK